MAMSKARAAILARARQFKFIREVKGKPNTGRWVEALQRIGGTEKGQPWCACYVMTILGIWYDGTLPQGLTYTASCDVVLAWARAGGLLVAMPEPGDLFLVMKSKNDASHIGFVTSVLDGRFGSIEGNASDPESPPTPEGWGVFERLVSHPRARKLSGQYLFVRYLPVQIADRAETDSGRGSNIE